MSTAATAQPKAFVFRRFRLPQFILLRFTARRAATSAAVWGVIFGLYTASKTLNYIHLYTTEAARQKVAETLGTNVGIEAILGTAHHIDTVPGYAAWNMLCLLSTGAAIWALLQATKYFRGDEDAGRMELMLSGQTTAPRAAANILAGLGASLLLLWAIFGAALIGMSHTNHLDFSVSACLFMALAVVSGAAMFLAVGTLASQLMPVRSRASSVGTLVFGVAYVLRIVADTTGAHWLLNLTPFGWIEQLQPLYDSRAWWLVPILVFTFGLSGAAIWFAGQRDLGDGVLADRSTARSRTRSLNSPFAAALRLTRASNVGWLIGVGVSAAFYGFLTKSAVQAFSSGNARHLLQTLTHSSQLAGEFLGIIFLLQITLVLAYVVSAVSAMRTDEAQSYLDDLLVQPVSRTRWFAGRAVLAAGVTTLASVLAPVLMWAGEASQHAGVPLSTLLMAGLNVLPVAALTLGIVLFAFGWLPRWTSLVGYAAVGWSFLLLMLGSGLKLSHWILDTSLLNHVALAPAVSPNWHTNAILALVGLALALLGLWRFTGRDLQTE